MREGEYAVQVVKDLHTESKILNWAKENNAEPLSIGAKYQIGADKVVRGDFTAQIEGVK